MFLPMQPGGVSRSQQGGSETATLQTVFLGDLQSFLGLGFDSAISAFREAVNLDPKSPGPQYALGQAQLKAGRTLDATTCDRPGIAVDEEQL